MGWWWSSSGQSQQPSQASAPDNKHDSLPRQAEDLPPAAPPPQPRRPVTRDELADAELQAFLSGMKAPNEPSQPSQSQTPPSSSSSSSSSSSPSPAPALPPSSINPDALYPSTMSCRDAFDYAFFCQSFGGQWVNYYRFGELRDCSQHWSDFWFCMRTKSYSSEDRARMVVDYNRKKASRWKTGPTSQDVWDIRTEPVKGAFEGDFAALEREMKLAEQRNDEQKSEMKVTGVA
ncbi:conserved hypothetical protein [Uncinocarpus reesii 1704]|uniref:Early meiotic induction protein 1 n=1 Tax=Uncinocarpus reesii (strain UAMH 1704) TaxID=336963 RepID=C4JPZ3_UNCRE|nr:uncharacterized protein UREG_03226 [Uncinocarpus reesii 1704]EEP78380.1 conserved hypothetical protein [Uncinocarpus reesii 1704]